MSVNKENYKEIIARLQKKALLVAVSKTKPIEDIQALYNMGHRDFGENYVQEFVDKYEALPKDIRWHFIGHLQSNKVKYIAPFVHLIHGVDSEKLLSEINKQGTKNNCVLDCLLQVHIAQEETKFGFDESELLELLRITQTENKFTHVKISGLMGMASFSDDKNILRAEFRKLKKLHEDINAQFSTSHNQYSILSMGMSGDYEIALEEGSNLIRIGSLLFGERNYGSK